MKSLVGHFPANNQWQWPTWGLFFWDVITYPCLYFNYGLAKPLLKVEQLGVSDNTHVHVDVILLLCCLLVCANNSVQYDPMVIFICLYVTLPHYHHYADLAEDIELLKCLSGTFCLECLRLSQFSQLSFIQYMWLCVFSLSICLMMIVRICVLYLIIIIKSEVWPIYHCLGLDYETMVCAVCLYTLIAYPLPKLDANMLIKYVTASMALLWAIHITFFAS